MNESIILLYEILCSENVVESINNNLEYLLGIIPEISYMIGFEHKHPHHHLDVWNHTLLALSMSDNDFDIRLSLLLHDIGKPFCYQESDGIRNFRGHPQKSAEISYKILNRLNFNDEFIERICFYIRNHDNPLEEQFIIDNREASIKIFKIQECDALAHHPEKLEKRRQYLKKIKDQIY